MPDAKIPDLDRPRWSWLRLIAGSVLLGGLLLLLLAWPLLGDWLAPHAGRAAALLTTTPSPFVPAITVTDAASPTASVTATPAAPLVVGGGRSLDGLMVLSLSEFGYARLFSHQLVGEPFTRLTYGEWDDISPALEDDAGRLAFASNRSGHWDLYLLDLASGVTTQLSDDDAYDGAPSWSTDGWVAYERDANGDLEIAIRPADGSLDPITISVSPARDHSPAWRPHTQQIAFISDRTGTPAVWVINLVMDGPARLTQFAPGGGPQASPAWSHDGSKLAWAQQESDGAWRIYVMDAAGGTPQPVGLGQHPRWNATGDVILAELRNEGETYLSAYSLNGGLALAPELLPGQLHGAAWSAGNLPAQLPDALLAAATANPSADWAGALDLDYQRSAARRETVALNDVFAPDAALSEVAIAPFEALRARAAELLGWDALSSLDYAFVPLGDPLPPTRQQDWLYTGRAFALRSGLLNAGWLAAVREDQNGQTYWRIYLRTANASGGLGQPLTALPWDFAARYTAAEASYQAGGKLADEVPAGYWVDFTALAADYGFERLPAQANWRTFFQGALLNEFALRAGLTWEQAMLQLYSANQVATSAAAAP